MLFKNGAKIFTNSNPNSLSNGLVSYYKLDGNSNGSVGNNGVDTSVSYSAGKLNNGADFNGTTSLIAITPTSLLNASTARITASCWVKINVSSDAIFFIKHYTGNAGSYYFSTASGKLTASSLGGIGNVAALANYSTGVWYHLCLVWKSNVSLDFYIDGVLQGTDTTPGAIPDNTNGNLQFGKYSTFNAINGSLDEIGIWNRALSSTEITALYGGGTPPSFDSFRKRLILDNVEWDADAVAFMTATGIPNNNTLYHPSTVYAITGKKLWILINEHVKELKGRGRINTSYNLWSKCKAIYPVIGNTAAMQKWNLKDARDLDVAFRLTYVTPTGGHVHDGRGLFASGTSYALTQLNPSIDLLLDDVHISHYVVPITSGGNWSTAYEMGVFANGTNNGLFKRSRANNDPDLGTDNAVNSNLNSDFITKGRYTILFRTAAATQKHCRDGVVTSSARTSGALANINFPLLCIYNMTILGYTNTSGNFTGYVSIGTGFTDLEATMMNNVVTDLQNKLRR